MKKRLGIISGFGNYKSVVNLIEYIKKDFKEIKSPNDINECTHIIFPGVGSYINVIDQLKKKKLIDPLKKALLSDKKNFLGICVGMQVLTTFGYEEKKFNGLDIVSGETIKIKSKKTRLPNIGWHDIKILKKDSKIFHGIEDRSTFYFLHSYSVQLSDDSYVSSKITLENEVVSSIENDNIYGVQFHPEKSQENGLKLINNFLKI
tara:strand:- start:339 stop:953 length:615 start_codon:yes stop_codon:yes gene_type:complete